MLYAGLTIYQKCHSWLSPEEGSQERRPSKKLILQGDAFKIVLKVHLESSLNFWKHWLFSISENEFIWVHEWLVPSKSIDFLVIDKSSNFNLYYNIDVVSVIEPGGKFKNGGQF